MTFAELVKSEREKVKLTQSGFADGINLFLVDPREHYSSAAVCTWENGQYVPYFSRLETIYHRAPAETWQYTFARNALEFLSALPVSNEVQGRAGDDAPGPG